MKDFISRFFDKIGHYSQVVDEYKKATDAAPDHALAFVNWGINLAQEGQLEEALDKFRQGADIDPERVECFTNWGVALAKMNRLDEAVEKFEAASKLAPDAVNNYILWGAALVEMGNLEAAQDKYEQAIAISPNNPEPFVNWGIALARVGRYHESIKHFKAALAIKKYQPNVYFLWGAVLAETEDYHGAIEKFKITLRYIPKHAEALYFWSVALNRLGQYEEAIDVARQSLALNADRPEIYMNLGDALANMNRLDVAIANYRHALMLDPDLAEAYKSWGIALVKSGKLDDGFKKFEKALELDPHLTEVYGHWGSALVEQKNYEAALPYLEKANQADPDNADVLLNWSLALIKLGVTDLALDKLFAVEALERWNPNVHYLLGTHYLGLEDYDKAIEHLKKTLEEDPTFEDAAINLALAYCETENTQEAIRTMRPVIRNAPDSPKANFFYGNVLYRGGDWKDAKNKFQKAIELADAEHESYIEPRIALGEIHLKEGTYERARELLEAAVSADPACIPATYLLGLCFLRDAESQDKPDAAQALYEKALTSMDQTIAHAPHHLEAHANRALIHGHLKSTDDLNTSFNNLIDDPQTCPDDASKSLLLMYWSQALDALGEPEQAQSKRQEAIELNPTVEGQLDSTTVGQVNPKNAAQSPGG